ncbi:helix-turn-helix domain-containing protein [Cupriavidus sp. AcVe19-6a]|uniref:helix-turn-helix domain-containing protein n=1 Tax=Cupriavidus sp. AcVe19-6a TaxID=2821358 RepID=UPI001AE78B8B|nr:helix-turn-helix transcriptional regulator [Cupriavidus sp. AcVe19-6a]MBP0639134.1 helix-turn-helix transcriptional regulator [Cupriavidus sp. AcVe19-6a]
MGQEAIPALARQLGHDLRTLRLSRNLTQSVLALQAGVSVRSLKNLEHGSATLRTLVRVAHALGRDEWLATAAVKFAPALTPPGVRVYTGRQRAGPCNRRR